jgi:hypothetical protein
LSQIKACEFSQASTRLSQVLMGEFPAKLSQTNAGEFEPSKTKLKVK